MKLVIRIEYGIASRIIMTYYISPSTDAVHAFIKKVRELADELK